uniref:Uncharacterized protein n=1 Tax=Parascaris univalens TaxID=6257 RepID=A0A915ADR5_PARUN
VFADGRAMLRSSPGERFETVKILHLKKYGSQKAIQ